MVWNNKLSIKKHDAIIWTVMLEGVIKKKKLMFSQYKNPLNPLTGQSLFFLVTEIDSHCFLFNL